MKPMLKELMFLKSIDKILETWDWEKVEINSGRFSKNRSALSSLMRRVIIPRLCCCPETEFSKIFFWVVFVVKALLISIMEEVFKELVEELATGINKAADC